MGIIYARVAKNCIVLRNVNTGQEVSVTPEVPFTTVRLLVGEFAPFEHCLKKAFPVF